ncbi:unnamed protein product [Arabidopsis thaliana]|uniref:Uncharacterized protein n=1 Tax=Arabidopsis thaliana TaxID=3702 RepID=A0A654G5P0_ARATH|nr:unnamed protein product [Arabidopsis thaliana]
MAARDALLKYLIVSVTPSLQISSRITSPPLYVLLRRFSKEVRAFLYTSEVTYRFLSIVKNFQKFEPSKVFSDSYL